MNSKAIYFLVALTVVLNASLLVKGDGVINCFDCGYVEYQNGTLGTIPEEYESVPFCGKDSLNNTFDAPTKPAVIVKHYCIFINLNFDSLKSLLLTCKRL